MLSPELLLGCLVMGGKCFLQRGMRNVQLIGGRASEAWVVDIGGCWWCGCFGNGNVNAQGCVGGWQRGGDVGYHGDSDVGWAAVCVVAWDKVWWFKKDVVARPCYARKWCYGLKDGKECVSDGVVDRCFAVLAAAIEVVSIGVNWVVATFESSKVWWDDWKSKFALEEGLEYVIGHAIVRELSRETVEWYACKWVEKPWQGMVVLWGTVVKNLVCVQGGQFVANVSLQAWGWDVGGFKEGWGFGCCCCWVVDFGKKW